MANLSVSLQTALSALQFNQAAIDVTSNNVSNANTEGYTRKVITAQTPVRDGQAAGVEIAKIQRSVSNQLIRELRAQMTMLGTLGVQDDFYGRMQEMFGTLDSDSTLSNRIGDLTAAFQALDVNPQGTSEKQHVVQVAVALAQDLNRMATEIQNMRRDADQGIATAVKEINQQLVIIEELNDQIAQQKALDRPTGDLEDQRDLALQRLSEQIDITAFSRADGRVAVFTQSGRALLDTTAVTLTHNPAVNVDASITYPGGFASIDANGIDLTTEITGGKIAGYIQMRDQILPNLTSEIDRLAVTLRDEVNKIHNDGATFPAPNALTGTRTVAGTDAFSGTGTVRIAVVDAAGEAVVVPFDFDLTALGATTVANVVTQINTALSGFATASINAQGKLVISADNAANGVVIDEGTSSVGGRGFSHYFGLNDFFVGDSSVSLSGQIAVRSDIVANPNLVATGEVASGAIAVGNPVITQGDNGVAQRIADRFTQQISFAAAGTLPALNLTMSDYAAEILGVNAVQADNAQQTLAFRKGVFDDLSFKAASLSGVNVDEELSNLLVYENAYNAAARLISVIQEMMDTLQNMV